MRPRAFLSLAVMAVAAAIATTQPSRPARAQSLAEIAALTPQRGLSDDLKKGLFGTIEFRSDNLQLLPQWQRVVRQYAKERPLFEDCVADAAQCGNSQLKAWRKIIVAARGLDRLEQVRLVNSYFNRWPYRDDRSIYGVDEYWATPAEFLLQSGDCEDYSIAKFFALRQLGFEADEVRVVIILDRIRDIGHAVLAVKMKSDTLILDSLSDLILSHRKYKHYAPQYSMNETSRWAHLSISGKPPVGRTAGTAFTQGR